MTSAKQIDGRGVTLGLQGPLDIYRKLQWESMKVSELVHTDAIGAIYCGVNGAISAWQLDDWLSQALSADQRWALAAGHCDTPGMSSKRDLQAAMRKCDALVACQQIANAGKHALIEERSFRAGYSADYVVDRWREDPAAGGEEGLAAVVSSLTVTFPDTVDVHRNIKRQHSLQLVLAEASAWWEAILRATDYWVDRGD